MISRPKYLDFFNHIYESDGFYGIINEVEKLLSYGGVVRKDKGLYSISTAGHSEDEEICYSLTHILSRFGNKHYVGCLRGGAYYFSDVEHDLDIEIIRK